MLVIRGIKKENQEKTWNNTSHVLSSSLCGLFGWNPNQFLSDIERAHRGDYKNPNSPIYMKFISWKVSQAVLDSIIRANRSRQTNISASQKYSDKVQKRMNKLLITRKEFRSHEFFRRKEFLEKLCKVSRSVNDKKNLRTQIIVYTW